MLEAVVVFVFYSAYEWLRAQVAGAPGIAQHHALQIVRLERDLAMFHEAAVQRWFLPNHPIIQGWDIYYGTVHFAGPILGLFWLYVRFPDRYRRWRDVLAATTLLGLLGFWLYPLAPPRLLPSHFGFVDTALRIGGMGVADKGSNRDTENLFAAMPSLHLGWSCWCAFALTPVLRRRAAKVFVLAYPLVTLTAVVVTANHYVLDGVGGLAAVMLGWLLVDGAIRLRRDHGWWWLPLARGT